MATDMMTALALGAGLSDCKAQWGRKIQILDEGPRGLSEAVYRRCLEGAAGAVWVFSADSPLYGQYLADNRARNGREIRFAEAVVPTFLPERVDDFGRMTRWVEQVVAEVAQAQGIVEEAKNSLGGIWLIATLRRVLQNGATDIVQAALEAANAPADLDAQVEAERRLAGAVIQSPLGTFALLCAWCLAQYVGRSLLFDLRGFEGLEAALQTGLWAVGPMMLWEAQRQGWGPEVVVFDGCLERMGPTYWSRFGTLLLKSLDQPAPTPEVFCVTHVEGGLR